MTLRKRKELHLSSLSHLILRKICLPHPLPGAFAKFPESNNLSFSFPLNYGFYFLEEELRGQGRKWALSSLLSYIHHPQDCKHKNGPGSCVIYSQLLLLHPYPPAAQKLTHRPRSQSFLKSPLESMCHFSQPLFHFHTFS